MTDIMITPPPIVKRSIVMSVSVGVSVCLSAARDHIFGTTRPIFTIFCARCLWLWLGPPTGT